VFSRKKIAAVSALLGGLVMTCTGAAQAYAAAGPALCSTDAHGNVTCIQRFDGMTPQGDRVILRQAQSCVPIEPLSLPTGNLLSKGTTRIGPQVTCSNALPEIGNEPAPGQEMPGLFG
jgi:hypothetical protein